MQDNETRTELLNARIYRDEPIFREAFAEASLIPPQYRRMRELTRNDSLYGRSEVEIFYRQGKFMEKFEDDFDEPGEFLRYFPTYQAMTDRQLRSYFSWRSRLRRGILEPTSLSFVFVYLYELLNQIGINSPEEGYHTLKRFWQDYRAFEQKLDRYLPFWLRDYIIYYDLDDTFLADLPPEKLDRAVLTLRNCRECGAEELFQAINSLSAYDLNGSRFCREHPEEVKFVVRDVLLALADYCEKKRKNDICRRFCGEIRTDSCILFRSAVFYDRLKRKEYCRAINPVHKYFCRNGKWSCERFLPSKNRRQETGTLLKTIDFLMRQEFGFHSTLKVEKISALYRELIGGAIRRLREETRKRTLPRLDLSRLDRIRNDAQEIQERLIVETPEESIPETPFNPPEPPALADSAKYPAGLTETEYSFLARLLGEPSGVPAAAPGGPAETLLVDSINEKFFDRFGDTVIFCDGETPVPVEEYAEELKGILRS